MAPTLRVFCAGSRRPSSSHSCYQFKDSEWSRKMSRIKTPEEKKAVSLSRDRRNLYGECPTSSRRNISRGKNRSRRELRRVASQELLGLKGMADDLPVD